ncbi:MAG: LLM class F420-dependent oxidoreductase, partial [Ilumatobacteraceae bacterium]
MKLSMAINYSGGFKEAAQRVVELEKAGLDVVWIAEAYSFDAISQVGYLAAITERVEIATGILNVYSRTAALMAMTAAGCDFVSGGRFILGLGASGPQVIEGFHGVPYEKPMVRIREYIESCRMIWAREQKFEYHGQTVNVPLPEGEGTGLGKPLKIINHPLRKDIPIWWASLMGLSVTATAQHANGWLPIFFDPEKFHDVWGDELKAGLAKRDPSLGQLEISAGGMLAIDDTIDDAARNKILDFARPNAALYIGGMGARDKNFYNTICQKYG